MSTTTTATVKLPGAGRIRMPGQVAVRLLASRRPCVDEMLQWEQRAGDCFLMLSTSLPFLSAPRRRQSKRSDDMIADRQRQAKIKPWFSYGILRGLGSHLST
jgi:hypothetical protein